LYVRLSAAVDSGDVKSGDRVEATVLLDVKVGDVVVVPAGSVVGAFAAAVRPAAVMQRSTLTLAFEDIRIGDQAVRLRALVVQALDPKMREEVWRAATAGGTTSTPVGGPGLLAGVLVASGGTLVTAGPGDVVLPVGTVLRIRLTRPIEIPRVSSAARPL
jgi:hypothetical protein